MSENQRYVPAAGHRALTRLYDPVLALTTRERRFRGLLREQVCAVVATGATVVDVGCGTGSFAIGLASARPDLEVVGVDGDHEVLAMAKAKPGSEVVGWSHGLATDLDLPTDSADAVVMSLLLHHLDPDNKRRALAEAVRILVPEGTLHIADWGRPQDPLMRGAFLILQSLDGFEGTRDHAAGRLPSFLAAVGLQRITTKARLRTAWGSLELIQARHP